jgi:hypothetical protein
VNSAILQPWILKITLSIPISECGKLVKMIVSKFLALQALGKKVSALGVKVLALGMKVLALGTIH